MLSYPASKSIKTEKCKTVNKEHTRHNNKNNDNTIYLKAPFKKPKDTVHDKNNSYKINKQYIQNNPAIHHFFLTGI